MHIILGLIGIATAAYFLIMRAQRGAEVASDLLDVADDIRGAARRFKFRRKYNVHPVESIEEPQLALGALACAFAGLDDLPTTETRAALDLQLRKHLRISAEEAQEMEILSQWLVSECGSAQQAVPRLSKKLNTLDRDKTLFEPLTGIIEGIATSQPQGLSDRQREALDEIKRRYRIG